ncbi:MAG: response regulator [Candidatus Eisenbacteria bacterium]|nr:response regulator [Candidatus Eisenbacteria bacterium]
MTRSSVIRADNSSPPRRPRVLVADDDQRIVELLQVAYSGNGFEVLVAFDGEEAWEVVSRGRPDLAVLDVRMPRRTGFDVVEAMRATEELASVPVLLISGASDTEIRLSGLMKGADDFLVKPFSPKELLLKSRRLLERTELLRGTQRVQQELRDEGTRARAEAVRLQARLGRERHVREALVGLARELNTSMDRSRLMNAFLMSVMGQLGVGSGALFAQSEDDPQVFVSVVSLGVRQEKLRVLQPRLTGPLASTLVVEGRTMRASEMERFPDLVRECGALTALGTALLAPVTSNGSLQGFLALGERTDGSEYTREDVEMLDLLCGAAAVCFETAGLFHEHEQTTLAALAALAEAVESKDPAGQGHTFRVADYAVAIARALDLSPEEVEAIRRGALLHDIGKTAVLDLVLHKPGKLSPEEMDTVKEHPVVGSNILRPLRFLAASHDIVRHHHERVDGRGYPDGLRGDSFCIGARIVAVADSFDALTTHRPYRGALTVDDTPKILLENSGTQYDVAVVEALIAELKAGRIRVAREGERAA